MEGRAASLLEAEHSQHRWSQSDAWRIASHWQHAGQPKKARTFLRACWQHAVSIGQPMIACHAIREMLQSSHDPDDRASLLDDLIPSLQAAGDFQAVMVAVEERKALSSRVLDTSPRREEAGER